MRKAIVTIVLFLSASVFAVEGEAIHNGWFAPDEVTGVKNPFAGKPGAAAEGKKVYDQNCAKCHGSTGKGDGSSAGSLQIDLPDFTDKAVTMEETDGAWFWKVKTGNFEMPPFQLFLTDEQVWKALIHTRSLAR